MPEAEVDVYRVLAKKGLVRMLTDGGIPQDQAVAAVVAIGFIAEHPGVGGLADHWCEQIQKLCKP